MNFYWAVVGNSLATSQSEILFHEILDVQKILFLALKFGRNS